MLEASAEEVIPFCIFCFKEPNFVTNMMTLWATIDEPEGANMKCNYKCGDG